MRDYFSLGLGADMLSRKLASKQPVSIKEGGLSNLRVRRQRCEE